jgi:hypothetical protein
MCDELTVKDDEEYLRKHDLTRRDFNKGAAGRTRRRNFESYCSFKQLGQLQN